VVGANIHDAKIRPETIDVSMTDLTGLNCLADSGSAGRRYSTNIRYISSQKQKEQDLPQR